jgi:hypothetical protein
MAWDKDLPDGDNDLAQCDDDIRTNNAALETAMDLEHDFTTGGGQTGRHRFATHDAASQALLGVAAADDGWPILRTDVRSGEYVWYVYDGTAWSPVDLGTGDVPRLDENTEFTASQLSEWQVATITPGATDELAVDLTASASQSATISNDTLIKSPSGAVAGTCQVTVLELTNSGAGHTLTWESAYRTSNGIPPLFDDTSGAVNIYYLTHMNTGAMLVTSTPNVSTF